MRRLSNLLKFCFALPIFFAIALISNVRQQDGWFEKLGLAVTMLPGYVISALLWLMVWAFALAEIFDLR
jgi:hypothetical protein